MILHYLSENYLNLSKYNLFSPKEIVASFITITNVFFYINISHLPQSLSETWQANKQGSLGYTRKIHAQDTVKLLITEFDTIRGKKRIKSFTFLGLTKFLNSRGIKSKSHYFKSTINGRKRYDFDRCVLEK